MVVQQTDAPAAAPFPAPAALPFKAAAAAVGMWRQPLDAAAPKAPAAGCPPPAPATLIPSPAPPAPPRAAPAALPSAAALAAFRDEHHDSARPIAHPQAARGWASDPCGPLFYRGRYHMFFQHLRDSVQWHWGLCWDHVVSEDLVHWRKLPPAIAPTPAWFDADGCFSGAAELDPETGAPVLLYTGVYLRSNAAAGAALGLPGGGRALPTRFVETQLAAVPADPDDPDLTYWRKLPEPVIRYPPPNLGLSCWRDPFILREGGEFVMLLASGFVGAGGAIITFRSKSLTRGWRYAGVLAASGGSLNHWGKDWECPILAELPDLEEAPAAAPGAPAGGGAAEGAAVLTQGAEAAAAAGFCAAAASCAREGGPGGGAAAAACWAAGPEDGEGGEPGGAGGGLPGVVPPAAWCAADGAHGAPPLLDPPLPHEPTLAALLGTAAGLAAAAAAGAAALGPASGGGVGGVGVGVGCCGSSAVSDESLPLARSLDSSSSLCSSAVDPPGGAAGSEAGASCGGSVAAAPRRRGRHFFCISPDACNNPVHYWLGEYAPRGAATGGGDAPDGDCAGGAGGAGSDAAAAGSFDLAAADGPHRLDLGRTLYAATLWTDPAGRRLLYGWVQEHRAVPPPPCACGDFGYAGCVSAPRVLALRGGRLHQAPLPELARLRNGVSWRATDVELAPGGALLPLRVVGGTHLDIEVTFLPPPGYDDPATAAAAAAVGGCAPPRVGLVFGSWQPGGRGTAVLSFDWGSRELEVAFDRALPTAYEPYPDESVAANRRVGGRLHNMRRGEPLVLRALLDGSVLEVFSGSGEALTTRLYRGRPAPGGGGADPRPALTAGVAGALGGGAVIGGAAGIALFAAGGGGSAARVAAVEAHELNSCWVGVHPAVLEGAGADE